ncbi:MAG: hypothetical protein ACRDJP_01630 [Actinomycetota bacterium]
MGGYVLVASHDPLESTEGRRLYQLAAGLVDHGDDVTVFLVQNGVLACRPASAGAGDLRSLASKATVVADEFSLRERAIASHDVVAGVRVGGMDVLVDALMTDGRKAMWI